ncbi:DUF2231 domain-containing protein [Actinokineospora pegani]|uniref:DUF2231 domain-containing protein n=1 Tax=Actinokineospora pegani TaxID=2654637 RepID=UPI0012EA8E9E|nr:DUF2231 domain-containing protein [Actinokineospora pegani]
MFEFVDGLPVHALVVHAVVVLIPLAALGAVVIAVWPAARRRYGWLVVGFAGVAMLLTPVASVSGFALQERLPENELIQAHEALGKQLIFFVVPLFLAVLVLMIAHQAGVRTERPKSWAKPVLVVFAVLSVIAGGAAGVQVYRVGDAGSRAVWDGVAEQPVR